LITGVIYEKKNYILIAVFAIEELGGVFVSVEARQELIVESSLIPIQWVLLPVATGFGIYLSWEWK